MEEYDLAGRVTSIKNRAGRTQTLTYSDGTGGANGGFYLDASGNPTKTVLPAGILIRVTDPFGRVLAFGYDTSSRVAKVTDPSGAFTRYQYNASSALTTVTRPDSTTRQYVYNEPANTGGANLPRAMTGIIDENGIRHATFKYDTLGFAVYTEQAGGAGANSLSYSYDASGVPDATTFTDPQGTTRVYSLEAVRGTIKTSGLDEQGASPWQSQTFDANGNPATRIDWNGNRTNFTFDLTRNLETARTEALTSGGSSTAQTRTITTQWHASFRLPTGIAEALRITTNVYDADGTSCGARGALCSKTIQATTDANGSSAFGAATSGTPRTWTYTYNANGDVLTVNGPRTDVTDTTTYTYYANNDADTGKRGNLASVTNALSQVTNITAYNAHGQPLTIVDPNSLTTTLAYDNRQRLTSRTVGGEATGYEYDGVGQLVKVTLPDSSFLAYRYDGAHRLTSLQDNLGNRIAYTLDASGNRTQEQVFDAAFSVAQTRSRLFDGFNRLFQELGAQSQTTEYSYDDQGNLLTVLDPLTRTTTNQYDALNRLKQVADPAKGVTQYAYNGLDALTQVTDPRTLVTSYTINGLGNLTQQVSPDTGSTVNTFDAAGNLLTQVDAKSQTTTYAYDALNRVTLATFHDSSKHEYAYDQGTNGIGRLSSITERDPANAIVNKTSYTYSQHGRVASIATEHAGVTYTAGYGYDSSGRMNAMTYPSGRTLAYGFDAVGRVNSVSTTSGGVTAVLADNVTYHPFGGVKTYTLGNGQAYTRAVDQDGRISSYTLGPTGYSIGFDAASRITGIGANTYGYDDLDRLTSAKLASTNFGYSYDEVGNRLTRTLAAGTENLTYSTTSNRIATLTPPSGPARSFTLDANGSTTADGLANFTYDVRGRMTRAVTSFATDYLVNALGQRYRKTNSTTDTVFHYDTAGRLIAETDPKGVLKREIVYLGDLPIGVIQ